MNIKEEPIDTDLHFEPLTFLESIGLQTPNLGIKLEPEDDPLQLETVTEPSMDFNEQYDIRNLQPSSSNTITQFKSEPPDVDDNCFSFDNCDTFITPNTIIKEEWPELDIEVLNYPHDSDSDIIKEEFEEDSSCQFENVQKKQKLATDDIGIKNASTASPAQNVIFVKALPKNSENMKRVQQRLAVSTSQTVPTMPYFFLINKKLFLSPVPLDQVSYFSEVKKSNAKNYGKKPELNSLYDTSASASTSTGSSSSSKRELKLLKCIHCSYQTFTHKQLIYHLQSHMVPIIPKCYLCSFRSSDKSILVNHSVGHCVHKPYNCFTCSYSTYDLTYFKNHLHEHYNEIKCRFCRFQTTDKDEFRSHIVISHKERRCKYCNYKTSDLRSHLLIRHPEKVKKSSNSFDDKFDRKKFVKSVIKEEDTTHEDNVIGDYEGEDAVNNGKGKLSLKERARLIAKETEKETRLTAKEKEKEKLMRIFNELKASYPSANNSSCKDKSSLNLEAGRRKHVRREVIREIKRDAADLGDEGIEDNCEEKVSNDPKERLISIYNEMKDTFPAAKKKSEEKRKKKSEVEDKRKNKMEEEKRKIDINIMKRKKDVLAKSLYPKNDKKLKCALCPYETDDLSDFKLHFADHPGDKLYKCIACPFESNFKSVVDKHTLSHIDLFDPRKT